ncbi:MAG: S8 family serine peptidase [Actinomycetota bacterium]
MTKRSIVSRVVRRVRVLLVGTVALAVLLPAGSAGAAAQWTAASPSMTTVFVDANGDPATAQLFVRYIGGRVIREFDVPGTFLADVPAQHAWLLSSAGLAPYISCSKPLSADQVLASSTFRAALQPPAAYDAATDPYSMLNIARAMGADSFWNAGARGTQTVGGVTKQVDVAIIDTGVAPVGTLASPGALIHGPDLSFDSQVAELAHNDTYGHGTHMAGIINAVAPEARIVSLKVGDVSGAVDATQVIAAIDWVREHRNDYGLNIRVLNLSYGLESANGWKDDELSLAVEAAWKAGIVVVVSAGNGGKAATKADPGVLAPAYNRNVLAVAAYDTGANWSSRADDSTALFTSGAHSTGFRNPDVSAPGKSIASYNVKNSEANNRVTQMFCDGLAQPMQHSVLDGGRLIRGSGTSQSAAAASGAVALILSKYPTLNPDSVKLRMRGTADTLGDRVLSGRGSINLAKIAASTPPKQSQNYEPVLGESAISQTRNGGLLFDQSTYDRVYAETYPAKYNERLATGLTPESAAALAATDAKLVATAQASLDGDRDIFGQRFSAFEHAYKVKLWIACDEGALAPTHALCAPSYTDTWFDTPQGQVWRSWGGMQNAPRTASEIVPGYADGVPYAGAPVPGTGFTTNNPVLGVVWPTVAWPRSSFSGSWWTAGLWSGARWRDGAWVGARWRDGGWVGARWRDNAWVDDVWEGARWRDNAWAGARWRDDSWSGARWRDDSFATVMWF